MCDDVYAANDQRRRDFWQLFLNRSTIRWMLFQFPRVHSQRILLSKLVRDSKQKLRQTLT